MTFDLIPLKHYGYLVFSLRKIHEYLPRFAEDADKSFPRSFEPIPLQCNGCLGFTTGRFCGGLMNVSRKPTIVLQSNLNML